MLYKNSIANKAAFSPIGSLLDSLSTTLCLASEGFAKQRHRVTKSTAIVIASLAVVYCGATAANADVVFADGAFNNSDWTVTQSNGLIDAKQMNSGGNPGTYRQTRILFGEEHDYALNVNQNFIYHPSTQGAITGLNFAEDTGAGNGLGGDYSPIFQQAGIAYFDPSSLETGSGSSWLHSSHTLKLSDFTRFDGSVGTPDFTATGASIEFGYLVNVTGSGFFRSDSGIDNYVMTLVTPATTAVPEPGAVALFVGMGVCGAGLLVRRRFRQNASANVIIRPLSPSRRS